MPFCTKCGRQINAGEQCTCSVQQASTGAPQENQRSFREETSRYMKYTAGEISGSVKNNVNSWKEELKSKDAYERGQQIVPDTIKANESEIPIRQYDHIAKLRSRLKLSWADGKMQLTNKRLIFRAPGRCLLSGKQVIQHEFAIDDISGIELRRDHRFSLLDTIFALLVGGLGMGISSGIFMAMSADIRAIGIILGLIAGAACLLPLFMIKEYRPYIKLFSFSAAVGAFSPTIISLMDAGKVGAFFGGLLYIILAIISLILILKIAFQPNLNITIKTQSGTGVIEIRRKQTPVGIAALFGGQIIEYTGYDDVLPGRDTDRAVNELGAIINDIQKLGDFAVEKWRQ